MSASQANEQQGILRAGMSRRGVLRRVGGGLATGAAAVAIARIEAHAASVSPAARGNEIVAQVTPEAEAATPPADLVYGGRSISYAQDGDAIMIQIDGVTVDMVALIKPAYVESVPLRALQATPGAGDDVTPPVIQVGSQYFSMYLPFDGYDTLDDLSRALVDQLDRTWVLE